MGKGCNCLKNFKENFKLCSWHPYQRKLVHIYWACMTCIYCIWIYDVWKYSPYVNIIVENYYRFLYWLMLPYPSNHWMMDPPLTTRRQMLWWAVNKVPEILYTITNKFERIFWTGLRGLVCLLWLNQLKVFYWALKIRRGQLMKEMSFHRKILEDKQQCRFLRKFTG